MSNVINFPEAPPAPVQPPEPDWAKLDQLLEQASAWLASEAGVEFYLGPNEATMEVTELCRHMLQPTPPIPGTYEPQGLAYTFANAINESARWLLNYYGDELDSEDHIRVVCLSWGTTEPAKRFGGWSSWGAEEVNYLLNQLSDGHWDDCGEKVPGFAIATGGLNIALAANEGDLGNKQLRRMLNGMWAATDFLAGCVDHDEVDERIICSLAAVHEACAWTGEAGPESVGITRCRLTLR